jgi:hypothetical protein
VTTTAREQHAGPSKGSPLHDRRDCIMAHETVSLEHAKKPSSAESDMLPTPSKACMQSGVPMRIISIVILLLDEIRALNSRRLAVKSRN